MSGPAAEPRVSSQKNDRSAPSVRLEWMEPTASAPAVTHQKGQQSTNFLIQTTTSLPNIMFFTMWICKDTC